MKLMVYGTLKRQYGNNVLLNGAKFLGPAITQKKYVLLNSGFPYAVTLTKDEEQFPMLPVIGEVYEINERHLSSCDSLEGHPNWYRRNTIQAVMETGEVEEVMIYEMNEWPEGRKLCNVVNGSYEWSR